MPVSGKAIVTASLWNCTVRMCQSKGEMREGFAGVGLSLQ